MKIMTVSPLGLALLLAFIYVQEVRTAEQNRSDDRQQGIYPSLDFQPAYRSTGSLPIPQQAHQPSPTPCCGSYPPSYVDSRHVSTPEGRTPPSGYFSDPSQSPHFSPFPQSPGYGYQPHPGYQQAPAAFPPSAGPLASLPTEQPAAKQGHVRQRSKTFNLGDLSLEAETDEKEMPVPRQLQDAVSSFTTERDFLIAAAQNFLRRAKEEGKTTIEGFNAIVSGASGDASPGETKRDSKLEKLTKKFQSKDKQAEGSLAQKRKNLLEMAEPYNTRFDVIGAQCTLMTKAFEDATEKLSSHAPEGAQSK